MRTAPENAIFTQNFAMSVTPVTKAGYYTIQTVLLPTAFINIDLTDEHKLCLLLDTTMNNNGHFYGAWPQAKSKAQCAIQKMQEKCIHTQCTIKKVSGHTTAKPRKNLHTASLVNKPKVQTDILQTQ